MEGPDSPSHTKGEHPDKKLGLFRSKLYGPKCREKHQQQEQLLIPQRIQIEYLDPQEVQKNIHSGSFLGYMSKSLTLLNISTYL